MDLAAIRQAMADALAVIPDITASPYILGGNATPPAIHLFPETVTYDLAGSRGMDMWQFCIQAFVGTQSEKGAQIRLDEMLASSGTSSVKAAVEADPELGGLVNDLRVTKCDGYQVYTLGSSRVLGATWTVEVEIPGS